MTAGEGRAYGNLGKAYHSVGDFKQVIEYLNQGLRIAKEVGDEAIEGRTYDNVGGAFHGAGDFKQAVECHDHSLSISS